MRVLIAGGGTGGHVIPALAIARELKARQDAAVLFVGTARGMETRLVPQAGFELALVKVGALKNVSLATRLRTLFDLPRAILQARKIIRRFRPDVVVGVGGYASGPAMAAAILEVQGRLPGLRVIHQTGERDYNEVQAAYSRAGIAAEVSAFIDNMPQAFAGADLLVCRSGASTVAEVTAAGKPAIFIPFPRAADDHQRRNAEAIAEAGAAVLLPESELTPERLAQVVTELLSDSGKLQQMAAKARGLGHRDAAAQVAEMVSGLVSS